MSACASAFALRNTQFANQLESHTVATLLNNSSSL